MTPDEQATFDRTYAELRDLGFDHVASEHAARGRAEGFEIPPPRFNGAANDAHAGELLPVIWARDTGPMLDIGYVVKDVIGHGELVVIYGAPKSGKTFLAADMGLSVAAGQPWFGHRVTPGLVLYIASEMGQRAERRVRAWLDQHGITGDPPFGIVPKTVNLMSDVDVEMLFATLDVLLAPCGKPALIVIDTLARSMVGGDENSAQDMGRAIAVGDRLRDRYNAATAVVHHSGKDATKGSRGSSALLGAADAYIRVDCDDSGNRAAIVEWSRDGESGRRYGFRLPVVELGIDSDGDPVTTCIVVPSDAPVATKAKSVRRDVALDALREAISEFGQRMPGTSTIPPGVHAVTLEQWRARWALRTGYDDSSGNSIAANFHKDKAALLTADRIAISKPYVWISQ